MWLDGSLIIDDWTTGSGETSSTNLTLGNDQRYDIRIEYFENTGDADIRLQWQFETLPSETIPRSQLYSGLPYSEFSAMPLLSPPPGSYVGITYVSLSTATVGAEIYYTLAGSEPYGDWTLYTGNPVVLSTNQTLRTLAVKTGMNDSGIRVGEYAVSAISYNLWSSRNFPGETDPAIIGKMADPDGDGVLNFEEYAYCLDPNDLENERRTALEQGSRIDHWMVEFTMPTNQTSGSFCWSPNLIDWIAVVIEKTTGVWVARSNHCAIATQEPLELDSLLLANDPIFFRFDKATSVPLAVSGMDEMQVGTQTRIQEWYIDLYLRADDPSIEQFLEIRIMSDDWLPPVNFAHSNNLWSVDNAAWTIIEQDEIEYSEWSLRVKLPPLPINAPVFLRYSVRER